MSTLPTVDLSQPTAAAAISGHLDTRTAATEVAHALVSQLNGPCDLALLFGSFHHRAAFTDAADIIRGAITPHVLLGATAESVLGVDEELEGLAGLTVIALRLPGVRLAPWHLVPPAAPVDLSKPEQVREWIGRADDFRAAILLADPFTTPIARLLEAVASCGGEGRPTPVFGGLASGASQPGHNVLIVNNQAGASGAVGVSIAGSVDVDCLVSQGCRPIGPPLVVTRARQNVILELGGRKAIESVQEIASDLSEAERALLKKGLLIGIVINEYKDRFGRGDFLIRNVVGFDQKSGGIAVADHMRTGQTVQFHVRDAATATEDLHLLLDAQELKDPAAAALLFTCNGRGTRLFNTPNHDLAAVTRRLGRIPIAGFFAAGEIGPIGDRSFVHGHTAVVGVFRKRAS
jgi:small ligand-binding sensory domain FIST